MSVLTEKIQAYYAHRREEERIGKLKAEAYKLMVKAENELIDEMLNLGMKSVTFEDGTKPTLARNVACSVTKDNFDEIRSWIAHKVGDDRDYVEETVNKARVTALVKKLIEDGADESEIPAFLKLSTRPGIRVYGWGGLQNVTEDAK